MHLAQPPEHPGPIAQRGKRSLIAGSLSQRIGAAHTLLLGGSCCIAGAVWFASALPAIRKAVRPIYVRLGILPEVTTGIANAAELTVPPE
jgi:hypothetical protein